MEGEEDKNAWDDGRRRAVVVVLGRGGKWKISFKSSLR